MALLLALALSQRAAAQLALGVARAAEAEPVRVEPVVVEPTLTEGAAPEVAMGGRSGLDARPGPEPAGGSPVVAVPAVAAEGDLHLAGGADVASLCDASADTGSGPDAVGPAPLLFDPGQPASDSQAGWAALPPDAPSEEQMPSEPEVPSSGDHLAGWATHGPLRTLSRSDAAAPLGGPALILVSARLAGSASPTPWRPAWAPAPAARRALLQVFVR